MRTIPARFKPNALLTGILLACSPLAASAVEEEVIRNNRGGRCISFRHLFPNG